jgi:hypothetical protein
MNKTQELQKILRHYRDVTGATDWDNEDVAQFAMKLGYKMPVPKSPVKLLAEEIARAARDEMKPDKVTGRPYRGNQCYRRNDHPQLFRWFDIDDAPRPKMQKSVFYRREQIVSDAVMIDNDLNHWNRINPNEEPLSVEYDLTFDVLWRVNSPNGEDDDPNTK